jgi:hypothetical protein
MNNPPPSHSSHGAAPESARDRSLQQWRKSARRVKLAWSSWLAAERGDRGVFYGAFVSALADEERAAIEVEQLARPSLTGERDAPGRLEVRSSLPDETR